MLQKVIILSIIARLSCLCNLSKNILILVKQSKNRQQLNSLIQWELNYQTFKYWDRSKYGLDIVRQVEIWIPGIYSNIQILGQNLTKISDIWIPHKCSRKCEQDPSVPYFCSPFLVDLRFNCSLLIRCPHGFVPNNVEMAGGDINQSEYQTFCMVFLWCS